VLYSKETQAGILSIENEMNRLGSHISDLAELDSFDELGFLQRKKTFALWKLSGK
jgi:hypothetical protein